MKTFPRLFKKTNTGAIQIWDIFSHDGSIITEYGQLDGKIQKTVDVIAKGKNIGKANETSRSQQADLECEAKWTKQLKKGYCQDLASAQAGEVDEVIEGGLSPMLAPSKIYPIFKDKLTWPVLTQPKLDGSRLIAILKNGKCTLWSRTRKPVNSLPHIAKAVEDQLGKFGDAIYDGEAYNFEYAKQNGFEGLMSVIRKDYPSPESEEIHYYIYDLSSEGHLGNRERDLQRLDRLKDATHPLVSVPTHLCSTHESVLQQHLVNMDYGYEGTMVRSNTGKYEGGKRSYFLQKLKDRKDDEFKILDAEEGRGKDAGTVGAFVCETKYHKTFKCRLKATYERRRELFNNPEQWQGWKLTVLYQDLTLDGIPRFPIGKALRKSEE
jgi:ATP-dependent DNA ligase